MLFVDSVPWEAFREQYSPTRPSWPPGRIKRDHVLHSSRMAIATRFSTEWELQHPTQLPCCRMGTAGE